MWILKVKLPFTALFLMGSEHKVLNKFGTKKSGKFFPAFKKVFVNCYNKKLKVVFLKIKKKEIK